MAKSDCYFFPSSSCPGLSFPCQESIMLSYYFLSTLLVLALPRHVLCQFPPVPTNVTTIHSQLEKGVYLSLKENTICDNTSGVKSYAGYVYLPERASADPILSQNHNSHTFWWFFESRKDPANAPLVIWWVRRWSRQRKTLTDALPGSMVVQLAAV